MKKIDLTWEDIDTKAKSMAHTIHSLSGEDNDDFEGDRRRGAHIHIYGIPRGGILVAQLVCTLLNIDNDRASIVYSMTEDASNANIFIDDIIDSGATHAKYKKQYPRVPFFALVNKLGKDRPKKKTWISFPWERMSNDDGPVENIVRLLEYIGEDPKRDGLKDTPERVIKSYDHLFGGYNKDPKEVVKIFEDSSDEMIILKNVEFYSNCEHHMLPFFGKAHIAYIPNGKVIGISKLARILEIYARRLQIQERLCQQVTGAIDSLVEPLGSACVLEAQHFCMTSRGVEKQNSIMITSSLTGKFKELPEARAEFMSMIK